MNKQLSHHWNVSNRREFFARAGSGLGAIALGSMLAEGAETPKKTHFPAKAKSVIWLFMEGGPSHIDLFDPKPELNKLAGKPMPASFGKLVTAMGTGNNTLMASPRTWKQHGKSGMWVSEWYPHIAKHVDDMTVIRSCWANGLNHVGSVCQMNTGDILAGRPSLGAWVTYGLGTANKNLPTFVVLTDDKEVLGGPKNWSSGFLPASYQGTQFRQGDTPILNLKPPDGVTDERQKSRLSLLKQLNQHWGADKTEDTDLDARVKSFELAYEMQSAGAEAVDITKETEATKSLYGMDDELTRQFGHNCLLARRLVERGVRFVELYCGSGSGWDAHSNIEGNHGKWCKVSDKPIAGLLEDLKQRGLLQDTLVVWGGEFGRTPFDQDLSQGKGPMNERGREHNPKGFTMFMAGGGTKPGISYGATDEFGWHAVEGKVHIHDLHATMLHLVGIDHEKLTYRYTGRDYRLTDVAGRVVKEILL